jgi:predicted ATPase/class 3 adenylate cyclase
LDSALDRRLVAVMFTDMVGYSAQMQSDELVAVRKRDQYIAAVEQAHAAFGGTIVQRLGDGTMSMFPSALAALNAAASAQRRLIADDVSVRIGIHVGEVVVEPERLTGDAVNIAARIESFAVPGGVLLSDAAREQLRNRTDVHLVSLDRFKLKSIGQPMELYAVAGDGLVLPDAQTLEGKGERFASLPSNLPEPASALVGRSRELQDIVELVRTQRIVTVTGPGGVGKTRLLVELGRMLTPAFLDGVAFVSLADVLDPDDFVPALAAALDVKEAEERSIRQGVVALIGDKTALLLLDNMEQIVGVAADVAQIVQSCPNLRIVATSRTPLRIAAEREYPLPTLDVPDVGQKDVAGSLMDYSATALFIERARTAKSNFEVTPENARAIADICRRLDGLPLALELAAARLRILSPQALNDRLGDALNVLTSGPRGVPERHQTLRATIEWSHSLLTQPDQKLFRGMAVFVGGCTVDDFEAVCGDSGQSALDGIESLVDKALVQVDGQTGRLRMLQTIGDYAREQLRASGEEPATALRHAQRYAQVARAIRDGIESAGQVAALARGVADEGNLTSALDTFLAAASAGDASAVQAGLQMCGDLYFYWHLRGKNVTAKDYTMAFLEADTAGLPTVARAGALISAGLSSWVLGEFKLASEQCNEAYRMAAGLAAEREQAVAMFLQGLALLGLDVHAGLHWASQSVALSRRAGLTWCLGLALAFEGILHAVSGDLDSAEVSLAEALQIQQTLGDLEGIGLTLGARASIAAALGDLGFALQSYQQARDAFEAIGDRAEEARILSEMA